MKRWLTAQQNDERQNNGDKKRLARHHPSDLLRLLTREWMRYNIYELGVVSPALRASPFQFFHVLRVRHLMCMHIPSCKFYFAKYLVREKGVFATPNQKLGHPIAPKTADLVCGFYQSNDVSRIMPGKKILLL